MKANSLAPKIESCGLSMNNDETEWQFQTHPYPPFVPEDAEILLLGSAPPFRFCSRDIDSLRRHDFDYYYGSSSNLFWEIMFAVFEPKNLAELAALRYSQRSTTSSIDSITSFLQAFLSRHRLALADILKTFHRCGNSAADYHLKVVEYQDIVAILNEHHNLKAVCCTSRNRVFYWLWEYLEQQDKLGNIEAIGEKIGFQLNDRLKPSAKRHIQVYVLPSPSARGIMRFGSKVEFLQDCQTRYKEILLPLLSMASGDK